jgi:hypothetical protein
MTVYSRKDAGRQMAWHADRISVIGCDSGRDYASCGIIREVEV